MYITFQEILADLDLFCMHPEARKVLLYALSPRDPRHFSPQLQESLFQPGDLNPYTRKPLGVRAMELRSPSNRLLPQLLRLVSSKLIELFTGEATTADGRLALEDRGRVVLLCEILLRRWAKLPQSVECLSTAFRCYFLLDVCFFCLAKQTLLQNLILYEHVADCLLHHLEAVYRCLSRVYVLNASVKSFFACKTSLFLNHEVVSA